jgi:hypothetical protein
MHLDHLESPVDAVYSESYALLTVLVAGCLDPCQHCLLSDGSDKWHSLLEEVDVQVPVVHLVAIQSYDQLGHIISSAKHQKKLQQTVRFLNHGTINFF